MYRRRGRRLFVTTVAIGSVGLMVLSACSSGSSGSSGSTAASSGSAAAGKVVAGTVAKDSLKGQTMTFVGFGGAFQQAQAAGWVTPFAQQSGAQVVQDTSEDTAKIKAMVEAKNVTYDVVYGGGAPVNLDCGTLYTKLDFTKIDVSQVSKEQVYPCQVPIDIEPELVVYNTKQITSNPPQTMADFFDFTKYPGKRAIPGDPANPDFFFFEAVSWYLNGLDKSKIWPVDVNKVMSFLSQNKKNFIYWNSYPNSQQVLEAGQATMAWVAAARPYQADLNGASYAPVWGACDYSPAFLSIPLGTPHLEAAYAFLNFAEGAEQQAAVTERAVYGPANVNAKPKVTDVMAPWVINADREKGCVLNNTNYWGDPATYKATVTAWTTYLAGG